VEIKLGQKVRDTITSMEGIAVARTVWLNGCVRIAVQSQHLKDGVPVELQTFDEPQLEVVQGEIEPLLSESREKIIRERHGSRPDATRVPDPRRR